VLGGAGAIAVEVNLTIVIESQCATQATLDERAGVGGDKSRRTCPTRRTFAPTNPQNAWFKAASDSRSVELAEPAPQHL
jgi:hypothetical protein